MIMRAAAAWCLATHALALSTSPRRSVAVRSSRRDFEDELRDFHSKQAWAWSQQQRTPEEIVDPPPRDESGDPLFPGNYWEYGEDAAPDGQFGRTRPQAESGGGLDADTSLTLGGPDADASFALPRVPNSVNPRVVLGVDEDAPMRQIRERFMHIARKCHPDTVPPAHAREAARVYSVALDAFMQLTERARGAG